ncbi:OmpA family protein [Telluribacter humicola]|uniref:OmpA family protein n=1 Tax=Telluribacter humicola TaxID=1720261 RepID=UPI001A963959|nr:OmpA family protein [Telluribacter humicola]
MSLKAITIVLGLVWLSIGTAIGQITQRPLVEEQYARYVRITRVELTSRYTIIDMEYKSAYPADLYRLFPNRRLVTNYISIDPRSRLYKPGNTTKKYSFIRAEGIAVEPEQQVVYPGDVVNFRVYYERLDPGIELFDFFEGRNPGQVEFWNFYGVHINNPLRPSAPAQKAPPREEPQDEPPLASTPQPGEAPRTRTTAPVSLKGTVYDASTRRPIPAQLAYADGADTLRLGTSSGNYRMSLAPEQRYALSVSAKGYLSASAAVNPADSTGSAALTKDFYLVPLKEGASITLNNIYFETSKFDLLRESYEELDQLVDMMRSNPSLQVRVEGHTDNLGDFDKNLELSRQRASAVRDYLINKGIASSRVEAKGYGSTRPVAKGTSEQERQRNRRVELVIVKI